MSKRRVEETQLRCAATTPRMRCVHTRRGIAVAAGAWCRPTHLLVSGAVAGIIGKTATAPLDRIKILYQVSYTSSMSLSIRGTMLSPSPCRLARQGRPPSQQWYPPPCTCRHFCPARRHNTAHAQNHRRRQVHPQQAQVRQSTGARTYCSAHSLRVAKPSANAAATVCTQPSLAAEDATDHSEQ